jgi:prefoldin subunit 5
VATKFSNLQSSTFPAGSARDSSEISVQSLITAATATANEIAGVQTTVATIRSQSDSLNTATNNLNSTETDINAQITEIQGDVQTLQANVAVLKNTLVTDLNKANTAITNLGSFQDLQLKMEIEHNLTNVSGGSAAIGDFELPASAGGYIDLVKTIVTNDIATELALGHGRAARANTDLANANNLFASHQWRAAYKAYATAYADVR